MKFQKGTFLQIRLHSMMGLQAQDSVNRTVINLLKSIGRLIGSSRIPHISPFWNPSCYI